MWMAENATHTMHNILTLRGAQVRDALEWSSYLERDHRHRTATDVDVKFQAHHWPMRGNNNDHRLLEEAARPVQVHPRPVGQPDEQRLHRGRDLRDDQAAAGTRQVLAEPGLLRHAAPQLPGGLPALHGLVRRQSVRTSTTCRPKWPPRSTWSTWAARLRCSKRARAISTRATIAGRPRSSKHVVFANPNGKAGKDLLADSSSSWATRRRAGPWRSVYLMGAYELRNGVPKAGGTISPPARTPSRRCRRRCCSTIWRFA